MNDIVERLRKAAATHFEGVDSQWCRENREAADEIERLQDLLAFGFNEGFFDYEVHNEDEFEEWIARVRKAIGEEET